MKKLNKKAFAGLGLGALVLVGGTLAYYNETVSLDNPLSTGKYENQLVEEFTPPTENLKPGQSWDKVVGAENTGDYPVLVRVKMKEEWVRKNRANGEPAYKTIESDSTLFNKGTYNATKGTFDAAQVDDKDGLTPAGDGTVVYKNVLTNGDWVNGSDGYWYWNGVLEAKGSSKSKTSSLMDKLVMAEDIDLGAYESKEMYAIAPDGSEPTNWVECETLTDKNGDGEINILDLVATKDKDGNAITPQVVVGAGNKLHRKSESVITANKGYADSIYTLTITSEFVQATPDAVSASWTGFNVNTLTKVTTDANAYVNK